MTGDQKLEKPKDESPITDLNCKLPTKNFKHFSMISQSRNFKLQTSNFFARVTVSPPHHVSPLVLLGPAP